jgi:hypothetical protein
VNTIRKITLLELFKCYEEAQTDYMKANGKFVVVPPTTEFGAALIDDKRKCVQTYRNELLTRLTKCEVCSK